MEYENQGGSSRETDEHENDELFTKIKDWVRADIDHSAEWRMQAREEYKFVAIHGQWTEDAKEVLKQEERPIVTFDQTSKYVKAICGLEINNRQMTTYLPRDVRNAGEVKANEILTNASDWMSQGTDASRQQSRAFRDTTICGMGWTSGEINYDDDPQGKYLEERCDPLEMGWDCNARDANLFDAKRRWRMREMTEEEARNLIPGITEDMDAADLDAAWASDFNSQASAETKTKQQKERREENTEEDPNRRFKILQIQWWEHETYVKTVDPQTQQPVDMAKDEFDAINAEFQAMYGGPLPFATLRRKVWKQAFVGGKILKAGPCPRRDGFTFNCITGDPDDTAGTWFGIVRVLRDPQVWANKFFAQMMHMINSTAKGGIIAESDAFPDIRQAQDSYARPNAMTIVNPGAVAKGKIMAKPGAAMTGGIFQLMQIADSMFAKVSGMNMELMGMADRQQPGVLEAQRKQSAMTILATLFDSLSAFRREVGAMRLTFIQDYLADGRLIRVHGDDGIQAIPLVKDKTLGQYDVIVDDAPSSTNMKEKAWAALMTLLPAVQDMLTPQVVVMLLDYVPNLPSRLVEELKKIASEPPSPEAAEMQKRGQMAEIEDKEASGVQKKTAAVLNLAKAANERAQQQMARVQAVDAQLVEAGLMDPRNLMADEPVFGPAPVEQLRSPQPLGTDAPAPTNPTGAPNVALPGGLAGF
jgi:hypothetical protein